MAFGGGASASGPGTAGAFSLEHATLLRGGLPGAVKVDGAALRVDEREKAGAGKGTADEFGAGDGSAVGEGEADVVAVAGQDFQVIRQLDDDIGGHGRGRGGAGTGEPSQRVGFGGGPNIGHLRGGAGETQGGFLAVHDAAAAVFALGRRVDFAQQPSRRARDLRGGAAGGT